MPITSMLAIAVIGLAAAPDRSQPPAPSTSAGCQLCPTDPGFPYCAADGIDPLVTVTCPSGNLGNPGHGCGNADVTQGGAHLTASGSTSPNTVRFRCDGIPDGSVPTLVRASSNVPTGFASGLGIRCVTGSLVRSPLAPGSAPFSFVADAMPVSPGNTRYYQVYYRLADPQPPNFNVSNGYVITW